MSPDHIEDAYELLVELFSRGLEEDLLEGIGVLAMKRHIAL